MQSTPLQPCNGTADEGVHSLIKQQGGLMILGLDVVEKKETADYFMRSTGKFFADEAANRTAKVFPFLRERIKSPAFISFTFCFEFN